MLLLPLLLVSLFQLVLVLLLLFPLLSLLLLPLPSLVSVTVTNALFFFDLPYFSWMLRHNGLTFRFILFARFFMFSSRSRAEYVPYAREAVAGGGPSPRIETFPRSAGRVCDSWGLDSYCHRKWGADNFTMVPYSRMPACSTTVAFESRGIIIPSTLPDGFLTITLSTRAWPRFIERYTERYWKYCALGRDLLGNLLVVDFGWLVLCCDWQLVVGW